MKQIPNQFTFIHLLSILSLVFSSLCFAVADKSIETTLKTAAASSASVDKIFELSGMLKQVEQIPSQIQQGLAQQHAASNAIQQEQYDAIFASINKSFSPAAIEATIRDAVQESLNQDEANLLLSWYQSEQGKTIAQAEVAAGEPEAVAEMMAQAAELLQDTDRLAFAQRLDGLLDTSDVSMQLFIDTTVGVISALSIAGKPEHAVDMEMIRSQMESSQDQIRVNVEQLTWASFIYAYKDVDLNTLQAYEDFLSKEAPLRFNRVAFEAFVQGVRDGINIWTKDLVKIFIDNNK